MQQTVTTSIRFAKYLGARVMCHSRNESNGPCSLYTSLNCSAMCFIQRCVYCHRWKKVLYS